MVASPTRVVPLLRNAPGGRLQAFVRIRLSEAKKEGGRDGKRDGAVRRGRSFLGLARVSGVVAQGFRTHRLSAEDSFHSELGHLERCYTPAATYPAWLRSYPAAEDAIGEEPHRLQVRVKVTHLDRVAEWRNDGRGTFSHVIVQ